MLRLVFFDLATNLQIIQALLNNLWNMLNVYYFPRLWAREEQEVCSSTFVSPSTMPVTQRFLQSLEWNKYAKQWLVDLHVLPSSSNIIIVHDMNNLEDNNMSMLSHPTLCPLHSSPKASIRGVSWWPAQIKKLTNGKTEPYLPKPRHQKWWKSCHWNWVIPRIQCKWDKWAAALLEIWLVSVIAKNTSSWFSLRKQ